MNKNEILEGTGRKVGKLKDGRSITAVAEVNPEGLPSDELLIQLAEQIILSGEAAIVSYDRETKEIIEIKPLKASPKK